MKLNIPHLKHTKFPFFIEAGCCLRMEKSKLFKWVQAMSMSNNRVQHIPQAVLLPYNCQLLTMHSSLSLWTTASKIFLS